MNAIGSVLVFILFLSVELIDSKGLSNELCKCNRIKPVCSKSIKNRIFLGTIANSNELQYVTALYSIRGNLYAPFCTGVLLNSEWVLTAGHCIIQYGFLKKFNLNSYVAVGYNHDLKYLVQNENNHRAIKEFLAHRQFSTDKAEIFKGKPPNDIGLVRIERPFKLGETYNIYPACIWSGLKIVFKTKLTVAGYGLNKKNIIQRPRDIEFANYTQRLLYTSSFEPVKECKNPFGTIKETTNLKCFVDRFASTSICSGDSGGPILENIGSKLYVIGISKGPLEENPGNKKQFIKCGFQSQNVFTMIHKYIDWIDKKINHQRCY